MEAQRRDRIRAGWQSAVFLLLAPGIVADPLGWLLIVAGTAFLVHAFTLFVVRGLGTPAPVAPTKSLVVSGTYRWVRNPMYLAVTAIILGQALLFASWVSTVGARPL